MKKEKAPSDLVTLSNLVHSPRESTKGSEENRNGTWSSVRDSSSEPNRSEPARWWTVLKNRHVLHARHPWLLPYHRFRHFHLPWLLSLSLVLSYSSRFSICVCVCCTRKMMNVVELGVGLEFLGGFDLFSWGIFKYTSSISITLPFLSYFGIK